MSLTTSPTFFDYCAASVAGVYVIATMYRDRDIKEDAMQVVETIKKYGKTWAILGLGVGGFYMMYEEKR